MSSGHDKVKGTIIRFNYIVNLSNTIKVTQVTRRNIVQRRHTDMQRNTAPVIVNGIVKEYSNYVSKNITVCSVSPLLTYIQDIGLIAKLG